MKNQLENYWKIYQMLNEWIRYSDTKAGIVLTVYGVILTLVYSNANNVYSAISISGFRIFVCIIISVLSLGSIVYAFLCLNPRLTNPNPSSVIYFGHIVTRFKSFEEYLIESEKILSDEKKLAEQLAEQIFINSTVAWRKFKNVTIAIRFFFLAFLLIVFQIFLFFISK